MVHSESAWPLPWYTRMHETVGFPSSVPSDEILQRTDVVITEPAYDDYFSQHLAETHVRDPGIYSLRPDHFLTVFLRKNLQPEAETGTAPAPVPAAQ